MCIRDSNNNTNYTRRHRYITHKSNCCQVLSRSRNDQPMLVNEYKFKEGWQSSSLKTWFLDLAEQKVNIFSANPNHSPRLLTNMLAVQLLVNFKTLLPLFQPSFHWSLTNKEANFLSHFYKKNIFIQTRRLWRVRNQPIEPFVIVSRVTRILQLIKKQSFLSAML